MARGRSGNRYGASAVGSKTALVLTLCAQPAGSGRAFVSVVVVSFWSRKQPLEGLENYQGAAADMDNLQPPLGNQFPERRRTKSRNCGRHFEVDGKRPHTAGVVLVVTQACGKNAHYALARLRSGTGANTSASRKLLCGTLKSGARKCAATGGPRSAGALGRSGPARLHPLCQTPLMKAPRPPRQAAFQNRP